MADVECQGSKNNTNDVEVADDIVLSLSPTLSDGTPAFLSDRDDESLTTSDREFDITIVLNGFKACLKDDEQLHLDGYITAYTEINKFFRILGHIFNFVANDVDKKLTILQCYRKGGAGDYYYSIQSMIEYEKEHDLLTSKDRQSGSRTLLRLHRALKFVIGFIEELNKASSDTKLGGLTAEVYNQTLAPFQGWILAKTVMAVLYLMPTKETIMERVTCGNTALREQMQYHLRDCIDTMTEVYNHTNKLYQDYELLDLP